VANEEPCPGVVDTHRSRLKTIEWGNEQWQLGLDSTSGGLTRIRCPKDPFNMNWIREAGHWESRNWVSATAGEKTADSHWGIVESRENGTLHFGRICKCSESAWQTDYISSTLAVSVKRELIDDGGLVETYTLKNTGNVSLKFPVGSIAFTAPLFDQYPDAKICQMRRCHVHLWMGGHSAWINALRMGTDSPHLGLVLLQGSLNAYSQRGGTYNDRGVFLLHPAAMVLDRGKSAVISWKLFWHSGWPEFFAKLKASKRYVALTARDYVVFTGESLELAAESNSELESATLFANGSPIPVECKAGRITASIPTNTPEDLFVELKYDGGSTWLRASVTAPVDQLIDSRVKFIVRHQQRSAQDDPLDGAYLAYDNEIEQQVYNPKIRDHNAGRERLAMGVLCAMYLPLCRDSGFKVELKKSLLRYAEFVDRELEDDNGTVFETVGREGKGRLYNVPWAARFHLEMYRALDDRSHLARFVRVMRFYYAGAGKTHYGIGVPIYDGIKTLEAAKRTQERDELLMAFRQHADNILKNSLDYPRFEVNYEQSIVAPAVTILSETYLVTGEIAYLEGARKQMPLLEAFAGKQPDARLNEVSIRHWDDYWFGKRGLYGDTMPHYWSTLNALAYCYFSKGAGERHWLRRADAVLRANLSLFDLSGRASCANLYAFSTNGQGGNGNDPWANDQDWALVHWLIAQPFLNGCDIQKSQ
jgi:hypothetical protein